MGRRIEENGVTETLAAGDADFVVALSVARIMLEVDLPARTQFAISNLLLFLSFFNPKTSSKPPHLYLLMMALDSGPVHIGPFQFHKARNNHKSIPFRFARLA